MNEGGIDFIQNNRSNAPSKARGGKRGLPVILADKIYTILNEFLKPRNRDQNLRKARAEIKTI